MGLTEEHCTDAAFGVIKNGCISGGSYDEYANFHPAWETWRKNDERPSDDEFMGMCAEYDDLVVVEETTDEQFVSNSGGTSFEYVGYAKGTGATYVGRAAGYGAGVPYNPTLCTVDEAIEWFDGDVEELKDHLGVESSQDDEPYFNRQHITGEWSYCSVEAAQDDEDSEDQEPTLLSEVEMYYAGDDINTTNVTIPYDDREYSFTMTIDTDNDGDTESPSEVLQSVADTVESKNNDYGNAIETNAVLKRVLAADDVVVRTDDDGTEWVRLADHDTETIDQQRLDGIFTRLLDKVSRLYTLSFTEQTDSVGEKRRETVTDLIGYLSHAAVDGFKRDE